MCNLASIRRRNQPFFNGFSILIKGSFFVDFGSRKSAHGVMIVALYARVSTSDQSCEMQLRELRQYVQRQGWQVFAEYVDTGFSGAAASRPQLDLAAATPGSVTSKPSSCGSWTVGDAAWRIVSAAS